MHLALQVWAGMFYLLNKVFFSFAERSASTATQRTWRIRSWFVYLVGLPAWLWIFYQERNWMVGLAEFAGGISMLLGLTIAIKGLQARPKLLEQIAQAGALIGIGVSIYDFGGITAVTQWMELGVTIGFLCGTYLLAIQKPSGYLFFLLMNGSNAILMGYQGYPWLLVQQVVSIGFVADAYVVQKRRANQLTNTKQAIA